jgi:hypothetical protein
MFQLHLYQDSITLGVRVATANSAQKDQPSITITEPIALIVPLGHQRALGVARQNWHAVGRG